MLAGCDEKGPALYVIDPSGTIVRYLAVAVGAGGESATSVLQDRYAKSMGLREAEDLAAEILKQVMEAKIDCDNIDMCLVSSSDLKYHKYDDTKLSQIVARLKTNADDDY